MSGLYIPGAFKKQKEKKEEPEVKEEKVIKKPSIWDSRKKFSDVMKEKEVIKPSTKKELYVYFNLIPQDQRRIREEVRFVEENIEVFEDLYEDMKNYNGIFLDKLRGEEGFIKFAKFVMNVI
jgi:hypothetical protein